MCILLQRLLNKLVDDHLDPLEQTFTEAPITTRARIVSDFCALYEGMYDEKQQGKKLQIMVKNKRVYAGMKPKARRDKIDAAQEKEKARREVRASPWLF
jgi:hypothetical protein